MGYMGLDCIGESDMAAGLAFNADAALAKVLKKGLKERANEYNTCGIVNVALYFEERIKNCEQSEKLSEVLVLCIAELDKLIKTTKKSEFGTQQNKEYHLDAYKRMRRNLMKIPHYNYEEL